MYICSENEYLEQQWSNVNTANFLWELYVYNVKLK